jgi:segregation and condensation protein B
MELERITSILESLLFAADRPLSMARFREVLGEEGPSEEEITQGLEKIKERTADPNCGFELRQATGGYHFSTKPQNAEWVQKFLQTKPFRLGRSSLEVLSIIAYRQPLTRSEIDHVRGIDSSHLLRTLMERGLVRMTGKAEVPGRPVQYGTTPKFLETVGLNSLAELPPLTELDQLQGDTKDPLQSLEEGLERIIQEEPETLVPTAVEDQKGLEELTTLIDSARQGSKEVYESPEQAEIAEANEQAVIALQSQPKPRRQKKTPVREEQAPHGDEVPTELPLVEPPSTDTELLN